MQIMIPLEGTSVTGLQAKELMGLTVNSINELSDSDSQSFEKFYEELYTRAVRSLAVDAQKILSGFYRFEDGDYVNGKFNINRKIATQETSEFNNAQATLSPSITLRGYLSMYSSLVINWVEFFVLSANVPTGLTNVTVVVTDNVTGQILEQKQFPIAIKKQKNRLATNFYISGSYTDITVSIAIPNTSPALDIAQTTQILYANGTWVMKDLSCNCPLGSGYYMGVYQTEPGLNVQFNIICDLFRFIEYNFALFQFPLYYSIGREFMKERVASDRINQYTVLTIDRANQLLAAYEKDYLAALSTLRDIDSVAEDMNCFTCKKPVFSNTLLP
jgi:hypothetical protein